jgi:hypothetical protein
MIELVEYRAEMKKEWDRLVKDSKNGTFLFYRDYLEYHSDRFVEKSFLVYKKTKLIGIIPGHISGSTYISHNGLTFGGFVFSPETGVLDVVNSFKKLNDLLAGLGIKEVIYKPVPFHYHKIPSQEDIYSIFLNDGIKTVCNIASVISSDDRLMLTESRKSGIRKSRNKGFRIAESADFAAFWEILGENLKTKYDSAPVHNLDEIMRLKALFPEKILLYTANLGNEIVGGTVLFVSDNVVRAQYISANETGKKYGALDLLFFEILNNIFKEVKWFDFGTSNGSMGKEIKENLVFQKEGFGGRGIVYETYSYNIR